MTISYWRRYEAENYFITPEVLRTYAQQQFKDMDLFGGFQNEINEVLDTLINEQIFDGVEADFAAWKQAPEEAARIVWEAKTERRKLSIFAEEFFRRLAQRLGEPMLLKKGELHRLVAYVNPQSIPVEVNEKLDLLANLFGNAMPQETDRKIAA